METCCSKSWTGKIRQKSHALCHIGTHRQVQATRTACVAAEWKERVPIRTRKRGTHTVGSYFVGRFWCIEYFCNVKKV